MSDGSELLAKLMCCCKTANLPTQPFSGSGKDSEWKLLLP